MFFSKFYFLFFIKILKNPAQNIAQIVFDHKSNQVSDIFVEKIILFWSWKILSANSFATQKEIVIITEIEKNWNFEIFINNAL